MKKFTNPLDNIRVASPCPANWDEMVGDERKRFCSQCNLNVYNLSGMTRTEAENLLLTSENRVCVRFYKRADGTVLTQNCPVGWQAVKRRVSRAATAVVSICAGIFTGLFAFNQSKTETPNAADSIPVQYAAPPTQAENIEMPDLNLNVNQSYMGEPVMTEDFDSKATVGVMVKQYEELPKTTIKKKRKR
jgi:hypothetical protein